MTEDKAGPRKHEPEEIRGYINRHYPDLGNAKDLSIGLIGGIYRVAVIDQNGIGHTLKIAPKSINSERALLARAGALRTKQAAKAVRKDQSKDHELER